VIAALLLAAARWCSSATAAEFVLPHGIVITTHRISFGTARPIVTLEDGGTLAIEGAVIDDAERDLALLVMAGELPEPAAVLSRALPDAGARFVVATLRAQYEAEVAGGHRRHARRRGRRCGRAGRRSAHRRDGQVWGMMRDSHRAIASSVIAEGLETLTKRRAPIRSRATGIWAFQRRSS